MATIEISVNGAIVNANARVKEVLACVCGTENPFSDTVIKGILETGKMHDESDTQENVLERAKQYANTFSQAGDSSDIFTISQIVSKNGVQGSKVMTFTRSQIANRFTLAFERENYQGEIVSPKWDSTAKGSKTEKTIESMDVI